MTQPTLGRDFIEAMLTACGCVNHLNGLITLCPLHAAAPALLAELERLYEAARCMADPEHCLRAYREHLPWLALADQARAAIRTATDGA